MSSIADITDTEQWTVSTTLKERWPNQDIELQLADVEIRMYPGDRELTECPALFWQVDEASFVIIKVAERIYRCQFYYRGYQQYGSGGKDFDDIADCLVTMLQVHADRETVRKEEQIS
ncbi:MAG: hypothetical protein RQ936_04660 [Gammaproteobacteria bacterium]|nr:hypothetical protein [Gammaproteobacteria bacterium]